MSALRSSVGPAVCTNGTSSSAATICASVVLPRPGGPASRTWSSGSSRARAASIEIASCSFSEGWPTKSSRRGAQRAVELVLVLELHGRLDARGDRAHLRAARSALGDERLGRCRR